MSRAPIAVAMLAFAPTGRAQLIDRVAAFVDDEVILLSEVRERAALDLAREPGLDPLEVHRRMLAELRARATIARRL